MFKMTENADFLWNREQFFNPINYDFSTPLFIDRFENFSFFFSPNYSYLEKSPEVKQNSLEKTFNSHTKRLIDLNFSVLKRAYEIFESKNIIPEKVYVRKLSNKGIEIGLE